MGFLRSAKPKRHRLHRQVDPAGIKILEGDCREVLRTLPAQSVHCVVTSPPYFGLRNYGMDDQIGLEQTPDEYVTQLVKVFREVRRVLRDDGTIWLNLGSCYRRGRRHRIQHSSAHMHKACDDPSCGGCGICWARSAIPSLGFKGKDLISIPALVALALQADGWFLRCDIIWAKKNSMPESADDRPTRAHEYLFLLTKRKTYYYDATAIAEDGDIPSGTRAAKGTGSRSKVEGVNGKPAEYWTYLRNKRSVWSIGTTPFAGPHFAVFPPLLVTPCIKAGTSGHGCCGRCGAPWRRVVEKERYVVGTSPWYSGNHDRNDSENIKTHTESRTIGWSPSCTCGAGSPVPCTVLDPFAGAGTTGFVADQLWRHSILIELNHDYVELIRSRLKISGAGLWKAFTGQSEGTV